MHAGKMDRGFTVQQSNRQHPNTITSNKKVLGMEKYYDIHILDMFGKGFFHNVDPLAQDGLSRRKRKEKYIDDQP